MSDTKPTRLPAMEKVVQFQEFETIIQIMPFGNNSLACLTSKGRIITPAEGYGQWVLLPTPTPYEG